MRQNKPSFDLLLAPANCQSAYLLLRQVPDAHKVGFPATGYKWVHLKATSCPKEALIVFMALVELWIPRAWAPSSFPSCRLQGVLYLLLLQPIWDSYAPAFPLRVLAGLEVGRLTVSRCNRSRTCLVFFIPLVSSKVQRRTKRDTAIILGFPWFHTSSGIGKLLLDS